MTAVDRAIFDRAAVRALASMTRRVPDRPCPGIERWMAAAIRRAPRVADVDAPYGDLMLRLDLHDNLQREVFYRGRYEPALHRLLIDELRNGDVFVDVGANIGIHSLPAAQRLVSLGGGLVVAFEAAPDTARALEAGAAANGIGAVTVVPVALGAAEGTLELRSSTAWGLGDVGVRSLYGEGDAVATVPVVRFDTWRREHGVERVDVVKIDVEGAEFDVLEGMAETLLRLRPRLLIVEVVDSLLGRAGASAREVEQFLSDHGYEAAGPSIAEIAAGSSVGPWWPNATLRPVERAR